MEDEKTKDNEERYSGSLVIDYGGKRYIRKRPGSGSERRKIFWFACNRLRRKKIHSQTPWIRRRRINKKLLGKFYK